MSNQGVPRFLSDTIISFIANVDANQDKAEQLSAQLADGIVANKLKLLQLVVALKDNLTSEDNSNRRKALFCLSGVLSKISESRLTKKEVSVLFAFYFSKIEDEFLVEDSLFGFCSLVQMRYTTIGDVRSVLDYLLNQYKPGSFLAPVRYFTFKIVENIYEKFNDILKKEDDLTYTFVKTFLHIANGEKDPKNLLISFNLNRRISSSLSDIDQFKEDLFDVLFCYFPITFKPPKNDPYNISNNDLKIALRSAISSTSLFAEDAFGNLIDKLTASSPNVKNDTLLTIEACVDNFGGLPSMKYWLPLWNALKFEIMHGSDGGEVTASEPFGSVSSETFELSNFQVALNILRSLANQLIHVDEHAFDTFLSHILEELKPNFQYEKDLKQSCSVLASIGSANTTSFNKVIECSLPLFLKDTSEIPKLKLVIMNLSFFFDAYITVFNTADPEIMKKIPDASLNQFKDDILIILGKALTGSSKVETTVRTLAVIQFTKMVKMNNYLNREEVALILQYLTDTILTDTNKTTYHTCLEGLKTIGESYEELVYSVSLKSLLDLLPVTPIADIHLSNNEPVEKEHILKVILDFTTSKHTLIRESLCGLSEKLSLVASQQNAGRYCFLIISSLYTLLVNNINMIREEDSSLIKATIETRLLSALETHGDILLDNHNLMLLSNVLFFINLKTAKETHQTQLIKYQKHFIDDLDILNAPSQLVVPFVKLICALDKDSEFDGVEEVFKKTLALVSDRLSCIKDSQRLGYLELLMILSNKWLKEDSIRAHCDWKDNSRKNLETLIWINKGLLMKNSSLAVEFNNNFLTLLSDKTNGSYIAKLFEIFVIDIVSMERYKGNSWCNNTKTLYKQKFFGEIFHSLVKSYKDASDPMLKSNYLTALSLVLKHTPSQLIETHMDEMLPMLLQALDLPISDVVISALDTLKDTAEKFHQLISPQAQTLVKSLLKLSVPGNYNNVVVRLKSLELLETLTKIVPLNYTLPMKKEIISSLESVLDDNKRVVRTQCVITRQAFFELGQVPFE